MSLHARFSSYQGDDYQYIHKSVIPTYHFQKSLRRLPIPKLEDSAKRYLNAVRAVVSESEYKEAEAVMASFVAGEGPGMFHFILL